MPVTCCYTSRATPPSTTTCIRYPLQPTSPPSIPYSFLEPRLEKKRKNKSSVNPQDLTVVSPGGVALLDQLVVEDSDSEDAGRRTKRRFGHRFSSAYVKLKRGILQEVGKRRKSHVVFGDSQEEIARRAELKRLMHQRIQDELKGTFQDDKPENPQSDENLQKSSLPALSKPGNGPRDCIDFAIDSIMIPETPKTATKGTLDQTTKPAECSGPSNGRLSLLNFTQSSVRAHKHDKVTPEDKASLSSISIASSEDLPMDDTLGLSPSQKSFQLSNSASRLDRILGPENGFSARNASASWDGQSALGVWLIAQGLRSRESSMIRLDDSEPEVAPSGNETRTPDRESQDTTVPSDSKAAQRLAPNEDQGTDVEHEPSATQLALGFHSEDTTVSHSPSEESSKGFPTSDIFRPPVDASSSKYPSVLPSFQPSPARSQPNLYRLDPADIQSMQFSPFDWPGNLLLTPIRNDSENKICYSTVKGPGAVESTQSLVQKTLRRPKKLGSGRTSLSQPDTASFLQRETELQSIERRFGDVLSRKKSSKLTTSRFREDLERPPLRHEHSSFMTKLYLSIPSMMKMSTRSQGSTKDDASVIRGGTTHEDYHEKSRPSQATLRLRTPNEDLDHKPKLEESATNLWQRAIRLEAEERQGTNSRLSVSNMRHKRSISTERSLNSKKDQSKGKHILYESSSTGGSDRDQAPRTDELSPCDPDSHSKWLIQHWVTRMQPEKLGEYSNTTGPGTSGNRNGPTIPPKSWARYPSHTRDQRTQSASFKDNVKQKDFAIKQISPDGQVLWATDRGPVEPILPESLPRSLSMKFGNVVKQKLSKLRLQKHMMREEYANPLSGRRGSAQAGGYLEYPELEILPTESGYRDLAALEHEIESMKGTLRQKESGEHVQHRKSMKSLGSRISALMHEVMEGHHDHDHDSNPEERPPLSVTPLNRTQSNLGESIAMTDVFLTPRSRLSLLDHPSQEKTPSDLESTKSDDLAGMRSSRLEVSLADDRPRSGSWIGKSLSELPTISQLDDFKRELENVLRKRSSGSSDH